MFLILSQLCFVISLMSLSSWRFCLFNEMCFLFNVILLASSCLLLFLLLLMATFYLFTLDSSFYYFLLFTSKLFSSFLYYSSILIILFSVSNRSSIPISSVSLVSPYILFILWTLIYFCLFIIIFISLFWDFFILANGFSLEFEWQQVCIWKSQRILCVSFSRTYSGFVYTICTYSQI